MSFDVIFICSCEKNTLIGLICQALPQLIQYSRSFILVGNKTDLARTRQVKTHRGCQAALEVGRNIKFAEISAGIGHMTDELLVGIVTQCR